MTERFEPETDGPTGLFLDTSGLYPYFDPNTKEHEEVKEFFEEHLRELPYRLLYTNQYVVDELVTLLLYKTGHRNAVEAYDVINESDAIQLLSVDDEVFEEVGDQFRQYRESDVSFTDHTIGVHADKKNIRYVLAYDGDFERLGLNVIPR